jgi:uncharacterized protein YeaO (DUF488 family)
MNLHVYRYGRTGLRAGLFVGVAPYRPRGIDRADYARRGCFDVWAPVLAPSRKLARAFRQGECSFSLFAQKYRAEMRRPIARQTIRLLAAASTDRPVHLGCSCPDDARCHRSILVGLVAAAVAELPTRCAKTGEFFSAPCAMPEIED